MQCTNPFYRDSIGFAVPCGKCLQCRIAYAREWSTRLLHEADSWTFATFLTLTYDEQNCPNELKKSDLQNFIKYLRRLIEPDRLKFYACGEYGDIGKRPHYHAIIFGVDAQMHRELFEKAWKYKGFVYPGTVTYDSCRYVADYIFDKYDKKKLAEYGNKTLPFRLVSNGIGKDFAMQEQDNIKRKMGITIQGKEVGIPRYYRSKIGITKEEFAEMQCAKLAREFIRLNSKVDSIDEVADEAKRRKIQRHKNTKARMSLKNKKL